MVIFVAYRTKMDLAVKRWSGRWQSAVFMAWMVALCSSYYALGAIRTVVIGLLGASSAAAILVGVRVNRPQRRRPWFMLAGAVFVAAMARVAYIELGLSGTVAHSQGRLAPVYALHLVMFILLIGAFISLARPHLDRRQFPALIDAAIVVVGSGLLAWAVVVQPWTANHALATAHSVARIAYVLRDVLILAALFRLVSAVKWSGAVALLTIGTIGLLVYDTLFRIGLIHDQWLWVSPIDIGWLTFYIALGAAALSPSIATMDSPIEGRHDTNGIVAVMSVTLAAFIPFALLFGDVFLAADLRPPVTAASAAMLILVLTRLTMETVHLRRSRREEAAIRIASVNLVGASDLPTIVGAVTSALRTVIGGQPLDVRVVDDSERSLLNGRSRLTVPLSLPDQNRASVPMGDLVVEAPPPALSRLRGPLQVIAAQVSLALARIRLTEKIISTRSEAYFRTLVQNATDVILIVDDDNRIRYASPSATSMFNGSKPDGRRLPELLAEADRPLAEALFDAKTRSTDYSTDGTVGTEWRLGGMGYHLVEMSFLDLRDEEAVRGFLVTLRDVTERRQLEDRLTNQAFQDPLTGLCNRTRFTAQVEAAVEDPVHALAGAAVLSVDLDDFKLVNDGYGHVVGDAYLRDAGERIAAAVRPAGLAARVGGDQFAVLVQGTTATQAVEEVAARVVTTLAQPTMIDGQTIRCGASVGLATTGDAHTSVDLLRHADLALYEAKGAGKQQWRRYDVNMSSAIMERLQLRAALGEALSTSALRLEYQPIVALDSGETVGLEALLRWEHPTRGRLGPAQFIDVAEDSGLIGPIGEWALRSALHEAAKWSQGSRQTSPYVSVNVSARQFGSADVFDMVQRALAETGVPPGRLLLEITESLLLHDDKDVLEGLRALRSVGVRIAVDDFGTGYSALSYLERVPLDIMKLDRAFTNRISSSPKQRELVAGIVQLAGTLKLEVVAEGIESVQEYGVARQIGCLYGQGYLFSKPLSPTRALRWVGAGVPA